jgi:transcriptional regulator with XRE-family HTH domain
MHERLKHPEFAANLERIRLAKGLSRPELERLVGLPANSVYLYETKRREPSVRLLAAIAKALGVTPGKLLEGWP